MKRFILAALVAALAVPSAEACGGRRAARVAKSKVVTRTKAVASVGVLPTLRNVVARPFAVFGAGGCPGGVCPTPGVVK